MVHPSFWDAAKAMLRGKCIDSHPLIIREEIVWKSVIWVYSSTISKEKQIKSKETVKKDIIITITRPNFNEKQNKYSVGSAKTKISSLKRLIKLISDKTY